MGVGGRVARLCPSNQLPGAPAVAGPQSQGLIEPDPWLPGWTPQPQQPVPRAHRQPPPHAADSGTGVPGPEHLQCHKPPKGMSCVTLGKFLLSLLISKPRGGLESGREKKWLKEEGRGGEGRGRMGKEGGEGRTKGGCS